MFQYTISDQEMNLPDENSKRTFQNYVQFDLSKTADSRVKHDVRSPHPTSRSSWRTLSRESIIDRNHPGSFHVVINLGETRRTKHDAAEGLSSVFQVFRRESCNIWKLQHPIFVHMLFFTQYFNIHQDEIIFGWRVAEDCGLIVFSLIRVILLRRSEEGDC